MSGANGTEFLSRAESLISNNNIEYIERKEYWGEKPKLKNLAQLQLPENCSAYPMIDAIMGNVPEDKWERLSRKEKLYIRYNLPYYQRLNKCLLPYKTRLVNIDFGNEHDYIISVPTEDQKEWKQWKTAIKRGKIHLTFYPPFDDEQVLQDLKENLSTLVE